MSTATPRTWPPIVRIDDSFDDPFTHDGHGHPDRYRQASRWQTARAAFPVLAACAPKRPLDAVWARAWTLALDARTRAIAVTQPPVKAEQMTANPELFAAGILELGKGPRRRLVVRRPGDRRIARPLTA